MILRAHGFVHKLNKLAHISGYGFRSGRLVRGLCDAHLGTSITSRGSIAFPIKPIDCERVKFSNKHFRQDKIFSHNVVNISTGFFKIEDFTHTVIKALSIAHTLERIQHRGAISFDARRHNIGEILKELLQVAVEWQIRLILPLQSGSNSFKLNNGRS